ncbi:MAG: 5-formyltetrahydrofolate cyclo-ligase [Alphaproteobacteria bacterium]
MSSIEQAKRDLARTLARVRIEAHRAAGRGAADALRASMRRARQLGLEIPADAVVAGYWPLRDEFDVRALLGDLHGEGLACALPVVSGPDLPLLFRRWRPGDRLTEGGFGIAEPASDRPEVRPLVLLVPLLGVDGAGRRLGYGKGYYDRTLADLRAAGPVVAIGVCFEAQRVREVPAESHDQRLDWVLTETGAWRAAG